VVTTAGLHGTVVSLSETTVVLKVDDGVRLKFDRSAIWQVRKREAAAEAAAVRTRPRRRRRTRPGAGDDVTADRATQRRPPSGGKHGRARTRSGSWRSRHRAAPCSWRSPRPTRRVRGGRGPGAVSSAALGAHRWFSGERIVRLDCWHPRSWPPTAGGRSSRRSHATRRPRPMPAPPRPWPRPSRAASDAPADAGPVAPSSAVLAVADASAAESLPWWFLCGGASWAMPSRCGVGGS
jgi:hypothetical protein